MIRRLMLVFAAVLGLAGSARAGHDGLVPLDTPIKRYPGEVAEVGAPDRDGHVYAFRATNLDYRPNEFRSWRLVFLSGELFGKYFQIQENSPSEIVVTNAGGGLDGLV